MPFDPARPWQRAPGVALRPEPFGALAYDFTTRRLSFLKSVALVRVVERLADEPSAEAALAGLADTERGPILRALATLADTGMITERVEETA